MDLDREKAIRKYFDKRIKVFKKEILKLAIEHDHPFIDAYLKGVIIDMEQDIGWNRADMRECERQFISFL